MFNVHANSLKVLIYDGFVFITYFVLFESDEIDEKDLPAVTRVAA